MELETIYKPSLALLTDLYELTMAYGYWKLGRAEERASFTLEFRNMPFDGGYALAAGLAYLVDFLDRFRFDEQDLAYLATLTGSDGGPLFDEAFLDYLRQMRFTCDVDAMPEGTAAFAHEPMVRVTGPIVQAQILETPILNIINFQTLIATKAARVCEAAQGDPVVEFGLRRAQGIDGGLAASRASFVGGCAATSNVLAGRLFGIPVKGTHAHSWVMSFDDEMTSFEKYVEVMPHNSILLVDTYHTLEGVRRAARVGQKMKARGRALAGIRLDSGDLAYLSIEARRILDDHGLTETKILASSELDEHVITSLKQQGAQIDLWGVGTRLATAYDQPALGGVYKLAAIQRDGETWEYTVKLSEQAVKVNTPGLLQVRRYYQDGLFMADMVHDEKLGIADPPTIVDPADPTRQRPIPRDARHEELLTPIYDAGRRIYDLPTLEQSQQRAKDQMKGLHPSIRRLLNPHEYPVGLERSLHDVKHRLIMRARGVGD
ncbi:MAG: nicotinate phosphoribosyltransferase [Phycisphaeraceae bacterium]